MFFQVPKQPDGLACPVCAVPVDPPRPSWFGPGERSVTCANGHELKLTTTFAASPASHR